MAVILEASSQLQWLTWWGEDAAATEQGNSDHRNEYSKGPIIRRDRYANLRTQKQVDDATMEMYHLVLSSAWDKVEEPGILHKNHTKYTRSLHWLSVKTNFSITYTIAGPDVRKVLIDPLDFENATTESQKAKWPLKAQGAPSEEWVKATADIG